MASDPKPSVDSPDQSSLQYFRGFVEGLVDFPLKEWILFVSSLRIKRLKKGDHLFQQGEFSPIVGFVTRGLIQTYYLDPEGKERTKSFAWEGRLIGNWAYQIQGLPSGFSARAIEDTLVIWISFERLEELQKKSLALERLRRKCSEAILIERERREYQLLTLTAAERYQAFLKEFSPILPRVPQYLIASYLGITPVALSRLLANADESPS
ncbi:MAG: Crp/Fnr family transcriptional regulator [Bdellovibrionales bacterium]